jgi:hypothetical protein
MTRPLVLMLTACLVSACSDGGSDAPPLGYESSFDCGSVPSCYDTALMALRQCVGTDPLTFGPPTINSGVAKGANCTGGEVVISFSDFSEKATGTVPTPSKVTITRSGALCMTLGRGTGTLSGANIPATKYTLFYLRSPDGSEVKIKSFEDGVVAVECPSGRDRYAAGAGALAACPKSVLRGEVTRDDTITTLGVDLVDLEGASSETLFSCK